MADDSESIQSAEEIVIGMSLSLVKVKKERITGEWEESISNGVSYLCP